MKIPLADDEEDEELTGDEAAAARALRPSEEEIENLVSRVAERAKGELPPPPVTPEDIHAEMGPASPLVDDLGSAVNRLFDNSGLPSVTLTDAEKDLFFNAALHNKQFELEIPLRGGTMKIRFKTLTIAERAAAMHYAERASSGGVYLMLPAIQQAHLLLHTVAINGVAPWEAPTIDPELPVGSTFDAMSSAVAKHMASMNEMRWAALLTAWRIFEAKCILAQKGISDENFWQPAVAA